MSNIVYPIGTKCSQTQGPQGGTSENPKNVCSRSLNTFDYVILSTVTTATNPIQPLVGLLILSGLYIWSLGQRMLGQKQISTSTPPRPIREQEKPEPVKFSANDVISKLISAKCKQANPSGKHPQWEDPCGNRFSMPNGNKKMEPKDWNEWWKRGRNPITGERVIKMVIEKGGKVRIIFPKCPGDSGILLN